MSHLRHCHGTRISPQKFQSIMDERKVEVKETRKLQRLQDLNRIQEMWSREGKHPVEIFPKEIWEYILNKLNPEDRRNMCQVHEVFSALMKNIHTGEHLLPLIWSLGLKQLGVSDILELRKVSKSLKLEVDRFFEQDILRKIQEGVVKSKPMKTITFNFSLNSNGKSKLDSVLTCLDSNTNLHRSLVSRSLTIHLNTHSVTQQDFQELRSKITRLLNHVGQHIWHFAMYVTDSRQRENEDQNRLTPVYLALMDDWLTLTPNLKWLQLSLDCCFMWCNGCVDTSILRRQPPPNLQSLRRLDFALPFTFGDCRHTRVAVCRAILESNPGIKSLHALNVLPLPSTPELETVCFTATEPDNNLFRFGRRGLLSLSPTLKRLTLRCDLRNESIFPVFEYLRRFPTLEKLSLDVRDVTLGTCGNILRLPQLKEFELSFKPSVRSDAANHFFSLQFLLHSKNLTKLTWNLNFWDVNRLQGYLENANGQRGIMINFRGGLENLSNSNLWQVFQYLEYVKTHVKDLENRCGKIREYRKRQFASMHVYSF